MCLYTFAIQKCISKLPPEAGIVGRKTKHSLRVSGASSLLDAGVPGHIMQSQTGHRSLEALRLYEKVTDDQNIEVLKIFCGEKRNWGESMGFDSSDKAKSVPSAQYNNEHVQIANSLLLISGNTTTVL